MIALALLLVASGTPAAGRACMVDHARYVLRSDRSFVLRFHAVPKTADWWAGLAIELDRNKTGRVSWWLPMARGSSDPAYWAWTAMRGTIAAATDYHYRLKSIRYLGFDAGYSILPDMLRQGQAAPAHIYLDDLRAAFWYSDDPSARESPPPAMFDLAGCDMAADTPDMIFPPVP